MIKIQRGRTVLASSFPAIIISAPQAKFLGILGLYSVRKQEEMIKIQGVFFWHRPHNPPRNYHKCAAGEMFLNFRTIFGQKIGKNDKNLKLFFKIFWHCPPFSQKISENKIRQRWSKYPPCLFKILQTRGGITSAIHRHPHRKKLFL